MTVFARSGELLFTTPVPFIFAPVDSFEQLLVGTFAVFGDSIAGAPLVTVSLPDGKIVEETQLSHPHELGEPVEAERGLKGGARGPDGNFAFITGESEIVVYDHDGEFVEAFEAAGFRPEMPSERDIERHRAGLQMAFGGLPSEEVIRGFASQPKSYGILGRSMDFDEQGRLWIGTQRDRGDYSYLDLYSESDFLGSIRIRDRLLGFDVYGSTLVALVERTRTDAAGIAIRAIDWYTIE